MSRILQRSVPLFGLALVLTACDATLIPPTTEVPGGVEVLLDVSEAMAAGFAVDEVVATFHRPDGAEPVVLTAAVATGSAVFEAVLLPGRWDILVELFLAEEVVGTGTGSVLVRPGFVTEVDLQVEPATGGVRLNVEWGEGFTGTIADIRHRPAFVEFPFGGYMVEGLSRIGWDIEVIESPAGPELTHKDPGVVVFPDIVMLGLTSTLEQVEALAAWIENEGDPRTITVRLRGLGGEEAWVVVFDVQPVDASTTIVLSDNPAHDEYTLAGVRLRVNTARGLTNPEAYFMEVNHHAPADPMPACAAPGVAIEIEGVSSAAPLWPCYPEGVLALPAAGTSDPLHLPAIRDGLATYQWAFSILREVRMSGCVGCASNSRRSMSAISMAGGTLDTETSRINLYEVWPSSFTFFDPESEYGHGYLFGATIVTDRVEDG